MIIFFIFLFLLFILAATFFHRLYRFHHRTIHDVIPFLRRLVIEELESLLDPRDEQALERNLSAAQFAQAQIQRIHLFREKIRCADHNACVLQDWAAHELERTYATYDAETRNDAKALLEQCREFRIAALWIKVQLNLWYFQLRLFPVRHAPFISSLRNIDSFDLLGCYRQLAINAVTLAGAWGDSYRLKLADLL